MRTPLGLFISLLLSLLASPAPGQLQPPTTRVTNCTNSGCHAAQIDHEFLHGPAAAGACDVCHVYSDEAAHRFALKRTGAQMCAFCHIGKTDVGGLQVHEPVKKGECLSCHNPHGSRTPMMLRGKSTGEMCLSCHDQVIADRPHVHTPVGEGDCLGCHRAHSSMLPNLLVDQGRSLCLRCHEQVMQAPTIPESDRARLTAVSLESGITKALDSLKLFVHDPAAKDCLQCHKPHASDHPALLPQTPFDLCSSCHKDIADVASQAVVGHSVVSDDRACLNCHTPHVSHEVRLLRDKPVSVCLSCHRKDIRHSDGTMTASVAELVKPGFSVHTPAQEGNCRGCHNPHGASFSQLLNRPYNRSFYQQFDVESSALCFDCHDQQLVTSEHTTSFTNFRNGDRNLHYVHVKAPGKGGRSCSVCHATHASASPKQLRSSVAFGQWKIPIQFTATDMGGSCAAGCHRAQGYDRVNPVSYELRTAPTLPGTLGETAQEDAPRHESGR